MAITTTNGKLAIMELETLWEPGIPLLPGTLGADDRQQLIWGFPEVLWASGLSLAFILDMNTRLYVYLCNYYGVSTGELTALVQRYLAGLSGNYNQRMIQLIQDATDAMS